MTVASENTFDKKRRGFWCRSAACLAVAAVLAGCSSAPDWADPGEIFSGGDETSSPAPEAAEPAEGFPNLSSVPGESPQTSSAEERETLSEGLSADRSNARYSDQSLTAESTLIPPAPPPPSAPRRTAPAPQAQSTPAQSTPAQSTPATPTAPAVQPSPAPSAPETASQVSASAPAAPPPPPPAPAPAGTSVAAVAPGTAAASAARPSPANSSPASSSRSTPQAPATGASGSDLPPAFPARAGSDTTSDYVPPTFEPPRYQLPGSAGVSAARAGQQAQVPGAPGAAVPNAGGQLTAVIYFGHGSSGLDNNDLSVLRDVVAIQRQNNARILVIGHSSSRTGSTDAVSHRTINLETSQKRADSVARALRRLGVPAAQVVTEARADNQPVFHEFMPTGEAGNRRAEIYLAY